MLTGLNNNTATMLVVFGATGDLVARKIAPALFSLYKQNRMPSPFVVVGLARRPFSNEQYRKLLKEKTARYIPNQDLFFDQFLENFIYQQGLFDYPEDYKKLAEKILSKDTDWKVKANKIFYLATPPQHYETILNNLHSSALASDNNSRILVEKPMGRDLGEAEKLDRLLAKLFKEEQIYRIDHYLAKETLQNIVAFRFANNLLEDVWSDRQIEKIEVRLLEDIDIEGRGEFYDSVGALLDVGQNHVLQMLALVTMNNPLEFAPANISHARAEVLEHVNILNTSREISDDTYRAQYRGYITEKGVSPNSIVETYFKLKTRINLPRWQRTEVYLEAGKKMPKVCKEIVVTFRHPEPCLCPPSGEHLKNRVIFRIEPDPGIAVLFWSKKPGTKMQLEEKLLEFKYEQSAHERYVAEYTQLLLDAIAGDRTLFISSREALAGWRFIDPIISAWRNNLTPLYIYNGKEHKHV